MQYTEREILERTNRFCENPKPFFLSDEREFLHNLVLDLLHENDPANKAALFAGIFKIITASGADKDDIAMLFRSVGFTAYENEEHDIAAAAFKGAVAINNELADRNNLAYVMRKSNNLSGARVKEIIDLLSDGVQIKEPYCLVNMALVFSVVLGTESDWKIADTLIAMVAADSSAINWWQELGEKDDTEGHLVHLWLQRHKVITESELGKRQFLWAKVSAVYPNVPVWLKTDVERESEPIQDSEQDSE